MSHVVFPTDGERMARPQASSALFAALAANTERFSQPYQYAIPPLQTSGISRRLSSAGYDSPSSGLPSPTWPTPPHTPSKSQNEPKPLLLPPSVVSSASPIRMSPRANPRRLSNASARFSRRVSLASAYSLSRPPSSARLQSRQVSVRLASSVRNSSYSNGMPEETLGEGDVVGHGMIVNGELVTAVDHGREPVMGGPENGANARYEIVRKLGSGSYATVFLAREILAEPGPPTDSDLPFEWNGSDDTHADPDMTIRPSSARIYGRSFAIKCLSRASLTSPESLAVQMLEATIHGSLPVHSNVVTLHAALESNSCLFLVLEYVRGPTSSTFSSRAAIRSPRRLCLKNTNTNSLPVPHPMSPSRTAPRQPHRSFPPSGPVSSSVRHGSSSSRACSGRCATPLLPAMPMESPTATSSPRTLSLPMRVGEDRRVVVKLSDFGLATGDDESADMDCGSAPYMSYECRNNCAPTYKPRAADVWSLGIVLINMLYHVNPWSDTFESACPSFTAFRLAPIEFFLSRFAGMTRTVATFLATRVFCIPDTNRIDAEGFGEWVKDLVSHFGEPVSVGGVVVKGCVPVQREGLIDVEGAKEVLGLGLVLAEEVQVVREEGDEGEEEEPMTPVAEEKEIMRTTTSGARKRGKRGAKKNKQPETVAATITTTTETAAKVQDLARELSAQSGKMSRESSGSGTGSKLTKKASKWSLFRVKNEAGVKKEPSSGAGGGSAATVKSLLTSLDAQPAMPEPKYVHPHAPGATHVPHPPMVHQPLPPPPAATTAPTQIPFPVHAPHTPSPLGGRRPADRWGDSPIGQFGTSPVGASGRMYKAPRGSDSNVSLTGSVKSNGPGSVNAFSAPALANAFNPPAPTSAYSPVPIPNAVPPNAHNAAPIPESTSAPRPQNPTTGARARRPSPLRSPTFPTGRLARSRPSRPASPARPRCIPIIPRARRPRSNVKYIEGTPWELDALPRQAHPRVNGQLVQGHIHGGPTGSRRNKPRNANGLGTISEGGERKSMNLERQRSASPEVPKKVQKGQINTLRGMLRAFGAGGKD
ncbi:Negative regulator of sexual conjugation and meiosis [Rhizoctonia solani]|uniref:Negative regulator of sexual conjugation and meiosis n=1 Tax=Rhizoctonia solani TaxID=456999 RepID=A0A8H8P6A5_9AGAM|nr:Negative regulator of sexual conjugation and meiosis [Rhizoctonia solani]QRW25117.1 Negative regulator of sexual conjugation and meiosis [Rhizoctonia solani]